MREGNREALYDLFTLKNCWISFRPKKTWRFC